MLSRAGFRFPGSGPRPGSLKQTPFLGTSEDHIKITAPNLNLITALPQSRQ
jgi:hypothetical protein